MHLNYDGFNALLTSVQTQVMFNIGVVIVMLITVQWWLVKVSSNAYSLQYQLLVLLLSKHSLMGLTAC